MTSNGRYIFLNPKRPGILISEHHCLPVLKGKTWNKDNGYGWSAGPDLCRDRCVVVHITPNMRPNHTRCQSVSLNSCSTTQGFNHKDLTSTTTAPDTHISWQMPYTSNVTRILAQACRLTPGIGIVRTDTWYYKKIKPFAMETETQCTDREAV